MAIYHCSVSVGSRKNGQSAKAKNAYINRSGKYSAKSDDAVFAMSEIPPAFKNADEFWSCADRFSRANATLFRQIVTALPRELNLEQQRKLVSEFAQKVTNFECKKLPFSLAIHHDKNNNNPHLHLVISEKIIDGIEREKELFFKRANKKNPAQGGASNARLGASKNWLIETRKTWQTMCNDALHKIGSENRIDARTLQEQKIDRVPTQHVGVVRQNMNSPHEFEFDVIKENKTINKANDGFEKAIKAETQKIANMPTAQIIEFEKAVKNKKDSIDKALFNIETMCFSVSRAARKIEGKIKKTEQKLNSLHIPTKPQMPQFLSFLSPSWTRYNEACELQQDLQDEINKNQQLLEKQNARDIRKLQQLKVECDEVEIIAAESVLDAHALMKELEAMHDVEMNLNSIVEPSTPTPAPDFDAGPNF